MNVIDVDKGGIKMSKEELLIALKLTQHNHRILMKLKDKAKEDNK